MKKKTTSIVVLIISLFAVLSSTALNPKQGVEPTATIQAENTATREPTPTRTPLPTYQNEGVKPAPSTWNNEPVMLTSPDQMGWFSDIFADASGTVHVAWSSASSTGPQSSYDVVYYRKTTNGLDWSDQLDIAAELTKGAVTRPAFIVDSQGIFHLTYRSYTTFYTNFPAVDVKPQVTSIAYAITAGDIGYFSRLAKDSQGRLHVIFTQHAFDVNCEGCFHVYYRFSDNNGENWSELVDISPNLNNGAAKPWIVIDQDDNIHVVIEVGRGGDLGQVPAPAQVSYMASYDRGVSWSPPINLVPSDDREGRGITIGIDGQGNLISAWLGLPEDQIFFRTSSDAGRTWSQPSLIPNVYGGWTIHPARLDTYSMATDSAGNVHLVAVGRTAVDQTSLSILELVWDGKNWSDPAIITTYVDDVPEWPRIAINKGNEIYVTWFVRKFADIWTNPLSNRVWFALGKANVPSISPIQWPTLTPKPTTRASSLVATETPQLVVSASPPNPDQLLELPLVYSENDYLLVIGLSIVPVIIFIAIVSLGVYWKRQR